MQMPSICQDTRHSKQTNLFKTERGLSFADSEHLGRAGRADTLGRGLAVLHRDGLGVLDFPLGATLHTIALH